MPKVIVYIDAGITHEILVREPASALRATNERTGVVSVGPSAPFYAARDALAGDVLTLAAGTYSLDGVNVPRSITLKPVVGAVAVIQQTSTFPRFVDVMVGASLTVEDMEFVGNKGTGGGGPANEPNAIYTEGGAYTVTLRRVKISDFNDGILAGAHPAGSVVLENVEVDNCGDWTSYTHGLYIACGRFEMRDSFVHASKGAADYTDFKLLSWGHLVKSRAAVTVIERSRMMQEKGAGNRCLDLPNGGDVTVRNCVLELNADNPNNNGGGQAMSYGVEEQQNPAGHTLHRFVFENNVVVNHGNATKQWLYIRTDAAGVPAPQYVVRNNVFVGFVAPLVKVIAGVEGDVYQPKASDGNIFISREEMDARMPGHASGDYTLVDVPSVPVGGWGGGANAGTFAADVWTPGRDASGLVNLASWNLVPLNRWVEVAGTRLDSLDSVVKAAVPGWRDYGTESWNGVTDDWVGMAWDERAGSERGWIAVGGGHSGSSNDGIYRFDVRRMNWGVQRMPSDPAGWTAEYKAFGTTGGSFTGYPPAYSYYYTTNQANPEGVFLDEFFDPADPVNSPRTPTARHTYSSCAFAPEVGAQGSILMGCQRYWEYDLATDKWAKPLFPFGNQVGYNGAKGQTAENMTGWWNAVEGRYYVTPTFNWGYGQAWSVLAGGTGWRWEGWYPTGGYPAVFSCSERIGSVLWTLFYDDTNRQHGKPLQMIRTDLATRSQVFSNIIIGASFAGKVFNSGWWDGQGMTFVPEVGKWLCNTVLDGEGMKWCWLDPETWTLELAVIPGNAMPPSHANVENKIKYLPDLHALVFVHRASENIRLIRFA